MPVSTRVLSFSPFLFECLARSNLHDSCTVVGDGLSAIFVHHQKIPAIRAKCRLDGRLNCETGIDVGNDLTLALGSIGS